MGTKEKYCSKCDLTYSMGQQYCTKCLGELKTVDSVNKLPKEGITAKDASAINMKKLYAVLLASLFFGAFGFGLGIYALISPGPQGPQGPSGSLGPPGPAGEDGIDGNRSIIQIVQVTKYSPGDGMGYLVWGNITGQQLNLTKALNTVLYISYSAPFAPTATLYLRIMLDSMEVANTTLQGATGDQDLNAHMDIVLLHIPAGFHILYVQGKATGSTSASEGFGILMAIKVLLF